MTRKQSNVLLLALATVSLFCLLAAPSFAKRQEQSNAATQQKSFPTPQSALDALIQAADSYDVPALLAMFGPNGKDLISSADAVADKNRVSAFASKAKEKSVVTVDKNNRNRATISVGNDDWPMPIPLAKKNGAWYFDSKAGHDEVLRRRIGANELDAIQVCRGYVEAQHAYAAQVHDGINQYAQKIISTPGKQDGLYWRNEDGSSGGPIGEAIARAIQEGYTSKGPYHGYYFKILKGQGPAAPLGQLDYVIQGVMIGGFALVATPAEYRVTGVQTFIVNQDGTVYQKDLGPNSLQIAKQMEFYNPDKSWRPTNDEWPDSAAAAQVAETR
ncbi:MAG TPA: DUF2950 domain-containing protein [Terriglobales bacterium]|nr:DUF2950 domain-containing protein [Terriglobales bacterium]